MAFSVALVNLAAVGLPALFFAKKRGARFAARHFLVRMTAFAKKPHHRRALFLVAVVVMATLTAFFIKRSRNNQ